MYSTARGRVEEVGGAGVGAVVVTVVRRNPDDGGYAADRDGEAEQVAGPAVVGQDLEELIAELSLGHGGARAGFAGRRLLVACGSGQTL